MGQIKKKFIDRALPKAEIVKKLRNEYGNVVIGEVTIGQVLSGMKGIVGLLTCTSKLDPEEGIRFRGYTIPEYGKTDLSLLTLPEEIQLIKVIAGFPELIEGAASTLEPHRLTFYLNDLAAIFHSYHNKNKVISDDEKLSLARLFLVNSIRTVVNNTLRLLGVCSPEKM